MKYESDKMQYISVLRVGSMLLIVLFHSMCFYTGNWWYLSADVVPFWKVISAPTVKIGLTSFVFISGYLYGYMYLERGKYRNLKIFLARKCQRLLVPYFFWGILMIITMPAVHISWVNLFTGIAHLWFLLMLFELFVLMAFFNIIRFVAQGIKIWDIVIVVISFILLYMWKHYSSHHYVLGIENTLYYLPAFLVGFYFAKYGQKINRKFFALLFFIIGIITMFILSFFGYPDSNTIYRVPGIIVSVSSMILLKGYSFSFCQSILFVNLDKNSMGIYILNQIVVFILLLIPSINMFLSHHFYLGVFIIFVVSFIIPWMLANMINKYKYISFLIGG